MPCSGAECYYNAGGETKGTCGNSKETGENAEACHDKETDQENEGGAAEEEKRNLGGNYIKYK